MSDLDFDRAAPRKPTNLSVNSDLLRLARQFGLNLSRELEGHLERVIARIGHRGELHRRILGFVVAHAPIAHSVEQIAAWTNCARGVIESDPPREFLDMGLLACERRSNGVYYRSTLKRYVSREFGVYVPEIEGRDLHRITQSLPHRAWVSRAPRSDSLRGLLRRDRRRKRLPPGKEGHAK